jgi:hypothetical protein
MFDQQPGLMSVFRQLLLQLVTLRLQASIGLPSSLLVLTLL